MRLDCIPSLKIEREKNLIPGIKNVLLLDEKLNLPIFFGKFGII